MKKLRPFFRFYGSKNRAAKLYPAPKHRRLVELFAGGAGYACSYHDLDVVLVEVDPTIAGVWDFLIHSSRADILRLPIVENVDDLPGWVPLEARNLIGFCMCDATTAPRKRNTAGILRARARGGLLSGWFDERRDLIAHQAEFIKHWVCLNQSWEKTQIASDATWFVDPPYSNTAGSYYRYSKIDYNALGVACRSIPGQVIVCENAGATWLPFETLADFKSAYGRTSSEVVWLSGC